MNFNKLNLEVGKCASTEESRYHLNGIHFTPEYTEATNGHILARVTYPPQWDDEYPDAHIKTAPKNTIKPFVVPAKSVKEIKMPKKSTLPCLNDAYVDVETTNLNGTAKFMSTDLETTPVVEVRKIDGEFPDTEAVWPDDEKVVFEISVDARYLSKMADIAASFGGKHSAGCTLTFWGNDSPMKISAYSGDTEQTFTGLIMPIRGNARNFSRPADPMSYLHEWDLSRRESITCEPDSREAKQVWKHTQHVKRVIRRLNA